MMDAYPPCNFPFPTLKQISLACIGQRLLDNTGRVTGLPDRPQPDHEDYDYPVVSSQFDRIVQHLPVPSNLKWEMFVHSMGMYDQLCHWLRHHSESQVTMDEEFEPIFDVNGIVDQSRTWEKYFERKGREESTSIEGLRDLMQVACSRALLPQIDTVLRKLLSEADADTILMGPSEEIEDRELILTYSFEGKESKDGVSASAYENLRWLNQTNWNDTSFHVTKRGLKIKFLPSAMGKVNMELLKKYLDLTLKNQWFYETIHAWIEGKSTEFLMVLLNAWGFGGAFTKEESLDILTCFLKWPFTRFFMPMWTLLRESADNGEAFDYIPIFTAIVEKIPDQQVFDVFGYGELLVEFWATIPSDVRLNLRAVIFGASRRIPESFRLTMRRLLKRNPTILTVIAESSLF